MTTFRKLIKNINVVKETHQQSSLELWFESIIDIPIEKLAVEDLCRAIRQELFIEQLMPRVLDVLDDDPLAGEYYDGELIAALSRITRDELTHHKNNFIKIQKIINQIDFSVISDDLKSDILKINQMIV
ncbi:contact-dependent growth inhibition system immunity protein [Pectobacterium aroidearum]|uniref:contact-dependent growth inhibition system immunity protein n=1 Tax=Pectobacterium aroidearum TaxID=1201031 RepID=UPI0030180731